MAEEPAKIRLDTSMVCRLQTVKRFQLLLFSESERPRPKLTLYVILKQLFTISNHVFYYLRVKLNVNYTGGMLLRLAEILKNW